MPIEIERPPRHRGPAADRIGTRVPAGPRFDGLRIALVNNMPDAALADTEEQFLGLLEAASGGQPIRLARHFLPGVARGPEARERLASEYFSLPELLARRFDGIIVTGAEPLQADLRAEPYWPELATVLRWAEDHTRSAILSCLAAHAAVLHDSGITRQPLATKRFGVFGERVMEAHPLTRGMHDAIHIPHSRWNEVRRADLARHGYLVLTHSTRAGTGLFVKRRGRSLFVHLQGHPEYQATTLLKEYRRDIRRFLTGQRPAYPCVPRNYFGRRSEPALAAFERRALARPDPALMPEFPDQPLAACLRRTWEADAVRLYRNWLDCLTARPAAALQVSLAGASAQFAPRCR